MPTFHRIISIAAKVKPRMSIDVLGDRGTTLEQHTHATRTFHPWVTDHALASALLDALRRMHPDAQHELESCTTDDEAVRVLIARLMK